MSTNPASAKHDPFPDPVSHSSALRIPSGDPALKPPSRISDFWALMGCNAIVFGASICIMVIELTASRLIAVHLGASLYTWTSVIGVVLAGISFGNYLGGWLADRFQSSQKLLSVLFVIASVLCLSTLWLNQQASRLNRPDDMHWPTWVLLIVGGIFLLPAMSLGTISPVVATMALRRSMKAGITVGNVYAWGALGSIVGTFFTGFYLLDVIGTQMIIVLTSAALAVMGLLIGVGQWAFRSAVLFGLLQFIVCFGTLAVATQPLTSDVASKFIRLVAGDPENSRLQKLAKQPINQDTPKNRRSEILDAQKAIDKRVDRVRRWTKWGGELGSNLHSLGLTLSLRDDHPDVYRDESSYYTISIEDSVEDGDSIKELKLDHLIHSYWNPDNPTKLYYDYERVYAAITERAASLWSREASVVLPNVEEPAELIRLLPPRVQFDPATNRLAIRGAMNFEQFRQLLKIGPDAEYWLAALTIWELSQTNRRGEFLSEPLNRLPDGAVIPSALQDVIHFDPVLRSLVTSKRLPWIVLLQLLELGNHRDYAAAVVQLYSQSRHVCTLFIGGGGFVFPRWIESRFPGQPHIDVAEIDPAVKLAVQKELGLPDDDQTAVRTHIGDARKFVDDRLRANKRLAAARDASRPPILYDFAYGDAFNDFSVPWHLTTKEFTEKIKALLDPEHGIFLVNIIDIYPRAVSDDLNDLPPLLSPVLAPPYTWNPAPDQFHNVEVRDNGDTYELGLRGVMSTETYKQLGTLSEAEEYRKAIKDMWRDSHEEKAGQFLGRYVATAREVFPFVYVYSSDEAAPGANRDTFVVTCSMKKLDLSNLKRASGYWTGEPFAWTETENGQRQDHGQMDAVLELARGHILTDDFAPVDNLLAPVFVRR